MEAKSLIIYIIGAIGCVLVIRYCKRLREVMELNAGQIPMLVLMWPLMVPVFLIFASMFWMSSFATNKPLPWAKQKVNKIDAEKERRKKINRLYDKMAKERFDKRLNE